MPKTPSLDQFKVPAFQRKRSLAAKARKRSAPVTALEKRIAGIPVVKPRRRVAAGRRARRRRIAKSDVACSGLYDSSRSGFVKRGISYGGLDGSLQSSYSSPLVDDEPSYDDYNESSDGNTEPRQMRPCGKIEGYISKIEVAIVTVTASIRKGDRLVFEAENGGLFEQTLTSMQINREDVATAYSGDDVGIKVLTEPKKGGKVFRVV